MLVKDLALDSNTLPRALKSELVSLGMWSMQYSIAAILKHLPAEPAITVNRNMLDGLLAQAARAGSATAPAT